MVGTFPLNVQAGSPKFYIPAVGNKNVGEYISVPTVAVSVPSGYSVIGNAYYTIMQDGDQDSWMTFYMPPIEDSMGMNVDVVITSVGANNNFSTTGNSTYMQCVWTKEYYDSLTTSISTVDNEINTVNSEINTLTPKVDNSFVNATKPNSYTLRLTRNDGTTVDISFPKGVDVRNVDISDMSSTYYQPKTTTASSNELVIISGSNTPSSKTTRYTFSVSGYGYLKVTGKLFTEDNYSHTFGPGETGGFTNGYAGDPLTFSGLLYNGGKLSYQRK